jgi:hypothetical protein
MDLLTSREGGRSRQSFDVDRLRGIVRAQERYDELFIVRKLSFGRQQERFGDLFERHAS